QGTASNQLTDTSFTDANGVKVGTEFTDGNTKTLTGYKLIGSYRLGDGSYTLEGSDSAGYSIPREAGDAHIYYGPGHNSAINVGDESFYVSHTRKDATEIAATLQVRKMLWTSDGWPVVSPVTYAGEKEQKLPKSMLTGTYDLASVGRTKKTADNYGARNFDLPVVSSKVTLESGMSIKNANGTTIGTWEFDNDHTVTLKFTASGDESKDEFYKSGDTMTMFALYGYDKDEAEPVIALTGTDQKHITQFAKKSATNIYKSTPEAIGETTPITLAKSEGGNPELGFDASDTAYAGDPAALVDGDTVYMYVGHDTATNESYVMPEWLCYSSKNMTDWTYEGVVMKATDISWRSNDTSAWASQCVKYGDKYYLYYCTWDKTSSGKQSIGVAVSNSPTGPFVDKGTPLVQGTFTVPESAGHDDIDPTVLIDTVDGVEHRYLAWGNTRYYVCELNEDMTSVKDIDGDNEIVMHKDIKEKKIKSLGTNVYTEAPWLYKRAGKYYLFFALNWRE
ncbi:MAG: family 43 glycosylhydrolase, partial [Clostridia bacterium]|nr:family 43 glycosylhydrolase [Clostridia bacterium]